MSVRTLYKHTFLNATHVCIDNMQIYARTRTKSNRNSAGEPASVRSARFIERYSNAYVGIPII